MIGSIGRTLVMAALLFAVSGSVTAAFAGARRSIEGWRYARYAAYAFSATMIGANLLMMYALGTHDFSVEYVAEVGSVNTPTYYTLISLWASLNGSILFWGGILGVYVLGFTVFNAEKHREYAPWTLAVLLGVSVFFAFLVASVADPFRPTCAADAIGCVIPTDGPGPNPLLQNHYLMAFHPPTLYLGYVGMCIPFSMCCAALLAGRLEAGWIRPIRMWFLIPWTFLTIGITMGGWWSYAVLGWGGYWAWDPVENASFMPWLTGTAFLHSAMVLERKGLLKTWTLVLGMSTFLLTLLGTFMTRSGVFNSVHSFTQSDIGPMFLGFIAITFTFSVLLLAFRSHLVEESLGGPTTESNDLLSRATMILLQNLAFAVFTATVLLGVLYPLIMEAWGDRKVSVGEPYFDRMALPLGLTIVVLMGIGPALPWGGVSPETAARKLAPPALGAVAVAAIAWISGIDNTYVLFALSVCTFSLASSLAEFIEPLLVRVRARNESFGSAFSKVFTIGRRRWGGHIAHVGIVIAVVAIAMSQAYKVEKDFVLGVGEVATIGPWTATYTGARDVHEPQRDSVVATFAMTRGGTAMGVEEPKLNFYPTMREPVGTPAVRSGPAGDVYLSLMQLSDDHQTASLRIMTMPLVPWLWISPGIIALGTLLTLWPQAKAAPKTAPIPSDLAPEGAA